MKNLRKLLPAVMGLVCLGAMAQESLGTRLGNFAGVNSALLNPASVNNSNFQWDFNLLSAGAYFNTDYAYLLNTNSRALLSERPDLLEFSEGSHPQLDNGSVYYDFAERNNFGADIHVDIMGPSLMFKVKKSSLGLFTRIRGVAATKGLDKDLAYDRLNSDDGETVEINPLDASGMLWSEVGLHLSKIVNESASNPISFGLNLKYLRGHSAYFLESRETVEVNSPENELLLDRGSLAFVQTNTPVNLREALKNPNGRGLGMDVGLEVVLGEKNNGSHSTKMGIAIRDLGGIVFKENLSAYTLESEEGIVWNEGQLNNSLEAESPEALGFEQSDVDQLMFYTPSSITANVDQRIGRRTYLNAGIVKNVPIGNRSPDQTELVYVAPRFESRWFELQAPLSLVNFEDLKAGASLRLAFFTIGTDDLLSWINQDQYDSSDIYVSVKLNPFNARGKKDEYRNCNGVSCPGVKWN